LRTTPSEKKELLEAGRRFGGMSHLIRKVVIPFACSMGNQNLSEGGYKWPK
jgi:hypothetical protein